MQSCPNVLSHKYFKLLSPASKSCYHGSRCCAAEMSPQRKPSCLSLTPRCAAVTPCDSRHTVLHARNGRHVSLSAPTLSGCNFSPLEESHTCFTLHLQNRRNKALSQQPPPQPKRGERRGKEGVISPFHTAKFTTTGGALCSRPMPASAVVRQTKRH